MLCMFRKLWLESFGTHLYTKHIKASHSITKLILQRPGLPFGRERLPSQSKSHQGLPFRALGFSTWIFFYDVFIFLMISSMVFHCFSLFSIVFQKKSTNHRPTVGSGLIRIGNRQRVWQLPILDHSGDVWWRTVRDGKVCWVMLGVDMRRRKVAHVIDSWGNNG